MKVTIETIGTEERVAELRRKIQENGGYCLCAIEKSPETKCMCKAFIQDTDEGPCGCGLYTKKVKKQE